MFENYSGDETFALILGIVVAGISWAAWYYRLASIGTRVRKQGRRWPLVLTPFACALLLYFVLERWSSEDVHTDPAYMLFYMVVGLAWLGLFRVQLPLFGVNMRDDVLERGNNAAGWACAGALLGGACCFAGGNVGNGPGWWVVLFSALLSTAALMFIWWIVHLCTGLFEKVTIERDTAAGLRAAGVFLGAGIILGRAVAGDWISAAAATTDFLRMGWPVLVLAGMAIVVERLCPPNLMNSPFSSLFLGLVPAFIYTAAGVAVMLAFSL